MGHFSETFRVKIDAELCAVRLSVRSVDERVDEHILDVRDFNAATQEVSEGWCGTDLISSKRVGSDVMVAIRESSVKRIIYRVTHQHWRLVCEQFISEVRMSGIEIQPYVVREKPEPIRIPIEEIAAAVQNTLIPQLQSEFSLLKQQINQITSSNLIQVTAIKDPTSSSGSAVFIPSDIINKDLSGNAQVSTQQSTSTALDEALEALRKLKAGE